MAERVGFESRLFERCLYLLAFASVPSLKLLKSFDFVPSKPCESRSLLAGEGSANRERLVARCSIKSARKHSSELHKRARARISSILALNFDWFLQRLSNRRKRSRVSAFSLIFFRSVPSDLILFRRYNHM